MSDKNDDMPNPDSYTPKRVFGHHNGTGRRKGSITKSTKITREIIAHALSGQEVNIMDALEKLSSKNPEAYINAIAKLLNYAVPKLQSTEIKSENSRKIEINLDDNVSIDELKLKMESLKNEDADDDDLADYVEVNE
tara:strand:+ start:527 stop:937 length:411 start_codon:yes stop_codon:yes gene_type:complete